MAIIKKVNLNGAVYDIYAASAVSATYAYSATSALSATDAYSASIADTATNAASATDAYSATYAYSAQNTLSATSALSATYTYSAQNTLSATSALSATYTYSAQNTLSATSALSADYAYSAQNTLSATSAYISERTLSATSALEAGTAHYVEGSDVHGNLAWENISALEVVSGNASISGFWSPTSISANIEQAIKNNINELGIVYHYIDSVATLPDTADLEPGSVYNITTTIALPDALDGENTSAFPGDNIVWNGQKWDKLAGTVSLDGYATTAWVKERTLGETDNFIDQHLVSATSGEVFGNTGDDGAWKAVTDYVDDATNNLTSADVWNETTDAVNASAEFWNYAYETVTASADDWNATTDAVNASAGFWNYAYDAITDAVKTSADMEVAANKDKLAEVEAITAYVAGKIAETVSETVDIAHEITEDTIGTQIPDVDAIRQYVTSAVDNIDVTHEINETTDSESIPDAGAVSAYVDQKLADFSNVDIHYDSDEETLHILTKPAAEEQTNCKRTTPFGK